MKLGELLKLYRAWEDRGIRDFAAELGISPATLSRIERGEEMKEMSGKSVALILKWLLS